MDALKSMANADCPYCVDPAVKILYSGYHRMRAALSKVKVIKEFIDCHDCPSFLSCCLSLYTRRPPFAIGFWKKILTL